MSPLLELLRQGAHAIGPSGFAHAVVRRFDRRTVGMSLVLLIGLTSIAGYGAMLPEVWTWPMPALRARMFTTAFTTFLMILAVITADEAVDRGVPRLRAYAVAVVGAAFLGALIGYELRKLVGLHYGSDNNPPLVHVNTAFDFARRGDLILIAILVGGLATFVHASRRTSLAARHRQHEAERARAAAQRRTLEFQLQELQARVEPAFLLGTLHRIRELYRVDGVAGSATLQALIGYLRAALPHLRESTATVKQETALTRAWLDIVARSMPGLRATFEIGPTAAEARLPALVLLPLVQGAIEEPSAGPVRLHVAIGATAGCLRIHARVSTAAFAHGFVERAWLDQIDQRLRALFVQRVRFELRAAPGGGSEATIELPLEFARGMAATQARP